MTDSKNGRYQVKYRSETADDFKISVTVRGKAIKDSPFGLRMKKRDKNTSPGIIFHVLKISMLFIRKEQYSCMIIDYMSLKYLIKGYFLQLFMATKVE